MRNMIKSYFELEKRYWFLFLMLYLGLMSVAVFAMITLHHLFFLVSGLILFFTVLLRFFIVCWQHEANL